MVKIKEIMVKSCRECPYMIPLLDYTDGEWIGGETGFCRLVKSYIHFEGLMETSSFFLCKCPLNDSKMEEC